MVFSFYLQIYKNNNTIKWLKVILNWIRLPIQIPWYGKCYMVNNIGFAKKVDFNSHSVDNQIFKHIAWGELDRSWLLFNNRGCNQLIQRWKQRYKCRLENIGWLFMKGSGVPWKLKLWVYFYRISVRAMREFEMWYQI